MLVQDTPMLGCHTGCSTTCTVLDDVYELREKQKNDRLALAYVPDVASTSPVFDDKRATDLLAIIPREFDTDDDACPSCLSRGLVVDDVGEFAVCLCMSFEPWASLWIEDVLNRLVLVNHVIGRNGASVALESAS